MGKEKERAVFQELVEAIENQDVPLSALWVFDFPPQDKDWNVTFGNDRAYMLELVAKANSRMQVKHAGAVGSQPYTPADTDKPPR